MDYGCHINSSATPSPLEFLRLSSCRSQAGDGRILVLSHFQPPCGCKGVASRHIQTYFNCAILVQDIVLSHYATKSDNSLDHAFSATQRCPQPICCRARELIGQWSLPLPDLINRNSTSICFTMRVPGNAVNFCRSLPWVRLTRICFKVALYRSLIFLQAIPNLMLASALKLHSWIFTRCDSLPSHASIFIVEFPAVLLAVCALYLPQVDSYVVYIDSTSALSDVENIYSSHPVVTRT